VAPWSFSCFTLSAAEALFANTSATCCSAVWIAAILSALLVFALHVPMLGNWWYFALVIASVLFTSLGSDLHLDRFANRQPGSAIQHDHLAGQRLFQRFIMSLNMLWSL